MTSSDQDVQHEEDGSPSSVFSHRIGAVVLFVFALAFGYGSLTIDYKFSSDPLGPETFPLGLSIIIGLGAIWYFLYPKGATDWPNRRLAIKTALLIIYCLISAALYEPAGFMIATFFMCTLVARLFDASWKAAVITGVCNAVLFWFMFQVLLDIRLPSGPF